MLIIFPFVTDRISGSIRPICLPIYEPLLSERFVDKNPFLAGYGTMRENGTMSPGKMSPNFNSNFNLKF